MISLDIRGKSNKEKSVLTCYIGLFFLLWTLYAFLLLPTVKAQQSFFYTFDFFKLLIWTLPVLAYLRMEKIDVLSYLKLKGPTHQAIKWTVLISMFFICYHLVGRFIMFPKISFDPFFDLHKWISGIILVGFTEELLFRGFILQKMANHMRFWYANLFTSFFFLLSHFPGYIALNQVPQGIQLQIISYLFIFVFGIIEGFVLKKTNSLWACMIIHGISNFMAFSLRV